ncbi:MAG: GNAT family N-acetyltransferase [Bradymonadaceae bacterium]|nr:GNAT family N-acetyltransferase [Lujinxingiaceae bacterium]
MSSKYVVEILDGVARLERATWDALVGEHSPFLEHGFLAALETTGCVGEASGWLPQIFVLREGARIVGALPLYLKTNSTGEFVFDWGWAEGAQRAGIAYYPKAVVGVPFTPVTGARLLVAADAEDASEVRRVLAAAAVQLAEQMGLSSVHFNFITEEEIPVFEELGLPIRTGLQYHWKNTDYTSFNAFLGRFGAKRRANIRRERRKLDEAGVTTEIKLGREVERKDLQRVFKYYKDTVNKFYYGQQYLSLEFFEELHTTLPDRLHLVTAHQSGAPFAGTFNLYKGERLYGRYWGALKEVEFTHFEVCMYRAISWCIEHGVAVFEPGAGGEHKFERGFSPTRTYSAHFIRDTRLRMAVADFITRERAQLEAEIVYLASHSPIGS